MEIRNLTPQEFDARIALSEYAFQFKLPAERWEEEKRFFRTKEHLGAFDETGQLMSALIVIPFETWIQGKKLAMGGIAGVASWPEARRQGAVAKLLERSLMDMRNAGQSVSALNPFSYSFYRKFGWELTIERKQYTLEPQHLPPRLDTPGHVARMAEPNLEVLDAVYNTYASGYGSTLVRSAEWWARRVLSKTGTFAVYYNEANVAEGYLHYHVADRIFTVHDFVAATETSKTALWTYISNHDSMINEVKMFAPVDDPLAFQLANPRFKQEWFPYFMSRIVDTEAFVGQYPFAAGAGSETLTLSLSDTHAEWNDGLFRLTWEADGSARMERLGTDGSGSAEAENAELNCDIQTFSALLTGNRTASLLHRMGRLRGASEAAALLERRVPPQTTFLMDSF